jgi:hypothetical protein
MRQNNPRGCGKSDDESQECCSKNAATALYGCTSQWECPGCGNTMAEHSRQASRGYFPGTKMRIPDIDRFDAILPVQQRTDQKATLMQRIVSSRHAGLVHQGGQRVQSSFAGAKPLRVLRLAHIPGIMSSVQFQGRHR